MLWQSVLMVVSDPSFYAGIIVGVCGMAIWAILSKLKVDRLNNNINGRLL